MCLCSRSFVLGTAQKRETLELKQNASLAFQPRLYADSLVSDCFSISKTFLTYNFLFSERYILLVCKVELQRMSSRERSSIVQWPGLGQTEVRSFFWVSHVVAAAQELTSSSSGFQLIAKHICRYRNPKRSSWDATTSGSSVTSA